MKKKIVCLGLALVLAAALAACGDSEKAVEVSDADYTAFKTVQEKMGAIKDAELHITAEASIKVGDTKDSQKSEDAAVIKEILTQDGNADMEIILDSDSAHKQTIYIKDGKAYLDDGNQKIRVNNADVYMQMGTAAQKFIAAMDREDLRAITKKGTDNPTFQLTIIDKDKVLGDLYAAAGVSGKGQEAAGKIEAKDMKIQLITSEGLPKTILSSGTYSIPYGEETAEVVYQYTLEFVSINTGLKIDFPDFKEYKSADTQK